MYYANAISNRDAVRDLVRSTEPPVTTVVFDPQVQHDLDFTTVDILTELLDWLEARDIQIHLVATHSDLVAIAKRAGLIQTSSAACTSPRRSPPCWPRSTATIQPRPRLLTPRFTRSGGCRGARSRLGFHPHRPLGAEARSEQMSESENPTPATSDDTRVAGVTDGAYALVVADFADTESAWSAYEDLKAVEDGATVAIEGVVVVKRGQDGKLDIQKATDHSTRSGLRWGVVGGIALGVIFPPSILGSAAALGAAGAATGKVRQMHHRSELAVELEDSIAPGHSGIIALVSDPGEVKIRQALADAEAVVERAIDDVAAEDIKAAAKEAKEADSSAKD